MIPISKLQWIELKMVGIITIRFKTHAVSKKKCRTSSIQLFVTLVVFLSFALGWLVGCSSKDRIFPGKFIVFRTDVQQSVEGRLYFQELRRSETMNKRIVVQGRLVFQGLNGWQTQEPIPSYSYQIADDRLIDLKKSEPLPIYSYWAMDSKKICYIDTVLIINNVNTATFDLKQLTLRYEKKNTEDRILLSSDKIANLQYFELTYADRPLAINHFQLIQCENENIIHCIELTAEFISLDEKGPNENNFPIKI